MTEGQQKNVPDGNSSSRSKENAKKARLASALRRNLLKRKDQQRSRAAEEDGGDNTAR